MFRRLQFASGLFALLTETHNFGPLLLIDELDVNEMLGIYHDLCQVSIRCWRYPVWVEWVPADSNLYGAG